MTASRNYPYIRAWCKMMGSYQYYTDIQLEKAQADGAPQNAVYHNEGKRWVTFDEVHSDDTRARIEHLVKEFKR